MLNSLLSPFVLPTDLVLLFGGEIILNVERLSNLLGGLSLDHIRDRLAANIKESLYVKIICCLIYESVTHILQYDVQCGQTRMISKSIS